MKKPPPIHRHEIGPVIGHEAELAALESLVIAAADDADARLPHALLLIGPAGIGKFRAALWMGSRLKCESAADCTGGCPSCKKIAVGMHPDVFVLDPPTDQRSIGIDDMRDTLIKRLSLRPTTDGPNVAIVRDAQKLTTDAQSALLKTLEEPLGRAFIVLVSDVAGSILATIRSRCRLIRMRPLADEQVEQLLIERGIESSHARRASVLSAGSPGAALAYTAERIEEREKLVIDYECCRAGRFDREDLVKTLADRRGTDRAGLPDLYVWQMKKIEAALGRPRLEQSEKLDGALAKMKPESVPRLLFEAERIDETLSLLARNVNAKLAIRDLLIAVRST